MFFRLRWNRHDFASTVKTEILTFIAFRNERNEIRGMLRLITGSDCKHDYEDREEDDSPQHHFTRTGPGLHSRNRLRTLAARRQI